MALFDAIERLNTAEEQSANNQPRVQLLPRPSSRATTLPRITTEDERQDGAKESELDIWKPSPEEVEERRRILNRKPERLSFLAPCPVCRGRSFLHIEGGGFACRSCAPGLFGYPVEATGPDRQEPSLDAEFIPSGEGNETSAITQPARIPPNEEQLANFAAAWPWIKENKAALLAAGWTIAALVRRSKFRWPAGPWGLAWLPVWIKPGLVVTIGRRGGIVFTFQSSGRIIQQEARQPAKKKQGSNQTV
ncbi:MAG: hypothetical protein PHI97_08950 [Desulfobulbus sp.]|nr:hypothetical protein [Desulfobulbus sp.]